MDIVAASHLSNRILNQLCRTWSNSCRIISNFVEHCQTLLDGRISANSSNFFENFIELVELVKHG